MLSKNLISIYLLIHYIKSNERDLAAINFALVFIEASSVSVYHNIFSCPGSKSKIRFCLFSLQGKPEKYGFLFDVGNNSTFIINKATDEVA